MNWKTVEEILESGKSVQVKVRGVSMYPDIFSGDVVRIRPERSLEKMSRGSIVLAKLSSGFVMHRLDFDTNGNAVLKGDNLSSEDTLTGVQILGVLTGRKVTFSSFAKRLFYFCFQLINLAKALYWKYSRELSNYYYDLKFNVDTCGEEKFIRCHGENQPYQATTWKRLNKVLSHMEISANSVFCDVGCGKGRALVVASTFPFSKIIGIELNGRLLEEAKTNIEKLRSVLSYRQDNQSSCCDKIELIKGDASSSDFPDEVTHLYMYSPFVGKTMEAFFVQIEKSYQRNPRKMEIWFHLPTDQVKSLAQLNNWKSKAIGQSLLAQRVVCFTRG